MSKVSFINVRLANNDDSEIHNFRKDQSQSLLKENVKYFKQEKLNILNYENRQYKYNKSGDIKTQFNNYRKLKKDITAEHKAAYKKAYKTNPKNKIFSDGVITFSTDIFFKFQRDKNINIFLNGKNYNLEELEKLHAQTEAEFFKYEKINKKNDVKKSENIKKEKELEKLLTDINNSIKFNFDINKFNEKGKEAIEAIAAEYNLNILYSTLHLDEKTPHFHFEYENFTRDKDGNIDNNARPVFKRKNGFTKKDFDLDDPLYVKNVGRRIQDIVAETFEEFNIQRGISKNADNINEKHLHAEQKKFWEEKIAHQIQLEKDLRDELEQAKKELSQLKETNKELTYKNVGIDAKNKKELEKYDEILNKEKNEVLEAHNKELEKLKTSNTSEINELKENLTGLIENKKELINIFKEMRAFISKNKDLDIDIKKILYSTFSENQTTLREEVKKLKEVKNYKHEQVTLKAEISKIIDKHNGIVSFDKNGANEEILKLINKYTEFDIQYKQMLTLNNNNKELEESLKKKDAEIKKKDVEIENLTTIQERAATQEKELENLKTKIQNIEEENNWKFFTYIRKELAKEDISHISQNWELFEEFKQDVEKFIPPANLTKIHEKLDTEAKRKYDTEKLNHDNNELDNGINEFDIKSIDLSSVNKTIENFDFKKKSTLTTTTETTPTETQQDIIRQK